MSSKLAMEIHQKLQRHHYHRILIGSNKQTTSYLKQNESEEMFHIVCLCVCLVDLWSYDTIVPPKPGLLGHFFFRVPIQFPFIHPNIIIALAIIVIQYVQWKLAITADYITVNSIQQSYLVSQLLVSCFSIVKTRKTFSKRSKLDI